MRFAYAFMTLALAGASFGDTLVLRNGQVVNGTYLGGSAREIKMQVNDQIQSFDTGQVITLSFSGGQEAPPPQEAQQQPPQQQYAQAPPPAGGVELAAGTPITVRLIDGI